MDVRVDGHVFDPLLISLTLIKLKRPDLKRSRVLQNYMFMYEDRGRYAYRHIWTREFVYTDEIGNVLGGKLNLDMYRPPLAKEASGAKLMRMQSKT